MDNEEFRTVRVYTKKYTSKDKDGNSIEKESKQKQVSLKKEDPFEDNDLVKVIPKEEYEQLVKIVLENKEQINALFCKLNEAIKNYKENDENLQKKIDALRKMVDELIRNLKLWCLSFDYSHVKADVSLNKDAYFITFNYTDTLERCYRKRRI